MQVTNGNIRYGEIFNTKTSLTQGSFAYRGLKEYNLIPASIRACKTMNTFKNKLRKWVMENVNIS